MIFNKLLWPLLGIYLIGQLKHNRITTSLLGLVFGFIFIGAVLLAVPIYGYFLVLFTLYLLGIYVRFQLDKKPASDTDEDIESSLVFLTTMLLGGLLSFLAWVAIFQ